ncbi:MAG: HNH endonuclease [Nocardiaceae bacterium]|nr:HNH endonuclease [Nocardiaceae bacterium]
MPVRSVISAGELVASLAAVTAALPERVTGSRAELVAGSASLEAAIRKLQGLQYQMLAEAEITVDDSLGGRRVVEVVADEARIRPSDARARLQMAAKVIPRISMQGEPLPPVWPNIAKHVSGGVIGDGHLKVVKDFFHHLPAKTDPVAVEFAEAQLADFAAQFRPDEMEKLAKALLNAINPDGSLDDERDRARKRHFTMHKQGADKMTSGRFCLDPIAAASIEALLAKFARRGMCNPDDTDPTVDHDPTDEQIRTDTRTYGQRCHDAIAMMARNTLCDENIGQHRGLHVSVVITADIKDLDPQGASQPGRTGGGLMIPINDVLALARHARNYLAVFDHGKPISLHEGRARRLATPGQRLMLHASDRGCTFPGCDRGGYYAQVHHSNRDWLDGGLTNIDDETLACDIHHPLAGNKPNQWKTRTRDGVTVWYPPKTVDPQRRPRRNHFHHPERRLEGAL